MFVQVLHWARPDSIRVRDDLISSWLGPDNAVAGAADRETP